MFLTKKNNKNKNQNKEKNSFVSEIQQTLKITFVKFRIELGGTFGREKHFKK